MPLSHLHSVTLEILIDCISIFKEINRKFNFKNSHQTSCFVLEGYEQNAKVYSL